MTGRRWIRFVEDGLATVMDWFPAAATPSQAALAERLSADLAAIDATGARGEESAFWRDTCRALRRLAAESDPRFFMRWDPIRATMVHGASATTLADWWMLRRSPDWARVWGPALRHPQFGHPPPFPPMMSTNAVAIEHARNLFRFRQHTGLAFEQADCIVEFGGGYGSMCRLVHGLGFRGDYIIFDLPHVLALQRYYLGLHGIPTGDEPGARVHLCDTLEAVSEILDKRGFTRISAISTWAMSEMPLTLRARIEPILERPSCGNILLAYQAIFEDVDNTRYFAALADRSRDRVDWSKVAVGPASVPPSPYDSDYLFGVRR